MPHFGKSNHQFRTSLDSTKQYRITAWLSFKQTWNDAEKRFDKNTPEEISICRKLFEQLAQHPGLQLQLNIDERMSGIDDVKQFPRAAIVNLYVGNMQKPDFQTQQNDAVETSQDLDDEIPFGNSDEADEMVGFE
jgi:hypothetical protein